MPPLLVDAVLRLLALLCALDTRRDRANLDLLQIRREVRVERERIRGEHVPSWRVLLQYLVFRTGEGL